MIFVTRGLRRRAFQILEEGSFAGLAGRLFQTGMILIIVLSLVALIIATDRYGGDTMSPVTWAIEAVAFTAFLSDLVARIWVAPEEPTCIGMSPTVARSRYLMSLRGVIDMVALLPFVLSLTALAEPKIILALALTRCLKVVHFSPSFRMLLNAVRLESRALLACLGFAVSASVIAGGVIHAAEGKSQPDEFGSLLGCIVWAMEALVSASSLDGTPASPVGKLVAISLSAFGFLMLAVSMGIVAAALQTTFKNRNFIVTSTMVSRVPLFSDLNAHEIEELVHTLDSINFRAGELIFRKGDPGDRMFFIMQGQVQVELPSGPQVLGPESFFGEMALITGEQRSATIRALSPTRTVAMGRTKLSAIMDRRPSIRARIEEAVASRRNAGLADIG